MSTFDRYLDIDGVSMSCAAWEHVNLQELLGGPAIRGQNRVMPGVSGVRPKRRRGTETTWSIHLNIDGNFDVDGAPYDDPEVGVVLNVLTLRNLVTDPIGDDSTRLATIHIKDSMTLVATVQVGQLEVGEFLSPTNVNATFDLIIVDGAAFTEETS